MSSWALSGKIGSGQGGRISRNSEVIGARKADRHFFSDAGVRR
jgi:hypothetical protein